MLEFNPSKRINAEQALEHIWIKNFDKCRFNNIDQKYFESVLKNISEFNAREKLQQATIAYIVHFLYNSKELDDLKKVFKKLDQNGDGQLTYLELKNGIEYYFGKYKIEADLNRIIQEIDGDNDGWISYEEFLRVSINQDKLLDEKNLKIAFDRFDLDKDGRLSKDEIKKVLGTTENEYINILINYIDDNNDGFINFEEFRNLMNGVVSKQLKNGLKIKYEANVKKVDTDIISTPSKSNTQKFDGTGFKPDIKSTEKIKVNLFKEDKEVQQDEDRHKRESNVDKDAKNEFLKSHESSSDSSIEKDKIK